MTSIPDLAPALQTLLTTTADQAGAKPRSNWGSATILSPVVSTGRT